MICQDVVVLLYFILVFVFFFKQKTAYEMRISDWSSDVCSSDLIVLAALAERLQRGEVVGIAEPFALAFVQRPVLVAGVVAEAAPQACVEVGLEAVVFEPGVVDIQQETKVGGGKFRGKMSVVCISRPAGKTYDVVQGYGGCLQ